MWKNWVKTITFRQEKGSTQDANKTGAESASGVSNLKTQTKKESAMWKITPKALTEEKLYKINDNMPFPKSAKSSTWEFTDDMEVGDSMCVKNHKEAAAIRYRMRNQKRDLFLRTSKDENNKISYIRIWRYK